MGPSRCFPSSCHGSEHGEGYRLGSDAALRALDLASCLEGALRVVGPCLAWAVLSLPPWLSSMLFAAFPCWNVIFVRKGLFGGLSLVSSDELSGLPCKSV